MGEGKGSSGYQHHHDEQQPPPPPPPPQYGTFQGVANYPPPQPAMGFPHPVPPPGASGEQHYYAHGYQAAVPGIHPNILTLLILFSYIYMIWLFYNC